MHVAILTWRDSTHPDGGGSEVFVEEVARELVRRGHRVTLRCARAAGAPRASDLDGVQVCRAGGRLTVYPRALAWLLRHRREVDVVVDVINGLPFATPLLRRHGVVALVHHVHERQWQLIYPGVRGHVGWFIESRATPWLYRRVPHLTVSESSRRDLIALGIPAANITVARNGLSSRWASAPRSPSPRLCVLARLVPHKRIEDAIAVAARLRAELPDLVLDLVGEGWWHERLVAEVRRRDAADAVVFHGRVGAAERDRLLGAAWVALLPSVKEGWGLAVLEAAAQGTPTVAYAHAGGVTESIVDEETGVLVEDADGLFRATRRLLLDQEARGRLGAAARKRAAQFTWGSTTEVVERVLAQSAVAVGQHR